MNSEKFLEILIFMVVLLFSLSFHESAHAYIADKRGDSTAKLLGRVSMNPMAHIDVFGTIIFPIMGLLFGGVLFGWAKPVPVNPMNLKNYKKDNLLISAAGPASNLILAIAFVLAIKVLITVFPQSNEPMHQGSMSFIYPIISMFNTGIQLNITLAIFNLIPVPPLDGSHILEGILPDKYSGFMERYKQMGFFIFILLLFSGILRYLSYPIFFIYKLLIGIFL